MPHELLIPTQLSIEQIKAVVVGGDEYTIQAYFGECQQLAALPPREREVLAVGIELGARVARFQAALAYRN